MGTSAAAMLLLGGAAAADEPEQESVETVIVTGSRIPQAGTVSDSLVTVVDRREINFEATTHLETLLSNLPSATADQGQIQTSNTAGIGTVNLRDLGSNRTLVLIDGKRLMPGDPTKPVADLNQIPAAMVDHVEVLTGGASATYGSDALAGAVELHSAQGFRGCGV
jgi:iron complex outermembrane recepter protein